MWPGKPERKTEGETRYCASGQRVKHFSRSSWTRGREEAKVLSEQPITPVLKCSPHHLHETCYSRCVTRLPFISIRAQNFPQTFTLHRPLAVTSGFDYGDRVSTSQGAGGHHLGVECSHRSLESRREVLKYPTSQGRLWLGQNSPRGDQGMFTTPLSRSAPDSHLARTQRLVDWIASTSGYFVQIYAERLTGARTERSWTSSVSPCMTE